MSWKLFLGLALLSCWALSGCRTAPHSPVSAQPVAVPTITPPPASPPVEIPPAEPQPTQAQQWGPAVDGLRLSLSLSETSNPADPELDIALENVATNDMALDLGIMLANGKYQLPNNIGLNITDSTGKVLKLNFFDRRFGAISGRIDDYAIPLRAGSTYILKMQLDQFYSGAAGIWGMKLDAGSYDISAEFTGTDAKAVNSDDADLRLMNFWTGKLSSNTVHVGN